MANTGNKITIFKDINPYSATYNQTKQTVTQDLTDCPNQIPNWVETSRVCNQIPYPGANGNNGQATVTETDNNPNSATYNQTRDIIVSDLTNCPLPNTTANWQVESTSCEQS